MCSNTQRKFHWKLIFLLFFWVSQVLYSAAVFNLFCWQKFCKTGDLVVFRINEGLSKVHASVGHRCTSDWRAVRQSALIFHLNNFFWKPNRNASSLYLHYKWFEGNIVVLSLTSLLQRPRCTAVCLFQSEEHATLLPFTYIQLWESLFVIECSLLQGIYDQTLVSQLLIYPFICKWEI